MQTAGNCLCLPMSSVIRLSPAGLFIAADSHSLSHLSSMFHSIIFENGPPDIGGKLYTIPNHEIELGEVRNLISERFPSSVSNVKISGKLRVKAHTFKFKLYFWKRVLVNTFITLKTQIAVRMKLSRSIYMLLRQIFRPYSFPIVHICFKIVKKLCFHLRCLLVIN